MTVRIAISCSRSKTSSMPSSAPSPRRSAGEALNVGAGSFGTVRDDLQALIDHAGSGSRLLPVPVRPAELSLRALELARLSPLAEWHYKTAHKDSFVSIEKARDLLGWEPRLSNAETLLRHLRLVSRASRGDARLGHDAPRAVGPAGARTAEAHRLDLSGPAVVCTRCATSPTIAPSSRFSRARRT